jgi:hypothetical protein
MTEKTTLPTLADLTTDIELAYKNDALNLLLSQPPPQTWVKKHPFISNYQYLPIDKIELLLKKIFKQFRIEITGQGTAFNGVWVTVRVHYLNPVSGQWDWHDGIGAAQLQLRAQTKEEKDNNIKVLFCAENLSNGAMSMAFPIAKTVAIKDACDMFGSLFGANLNRKDVVEFTPEKSVTEAFTKSNKDKMGVQND